MYCLSSYLNGLNGFEYFESVEEMQHFLKSSASFTPSMKMFSPRDVYVKSSALAEGGEKEPIMRRK